MGDQEPTCALFKLIRRKRAFAARIVAVPKGLPHRQGIRRAYAGRHACALLDATVAAQIQALGSPRRWRVSQDTSLAKPWPRRGVQMAGGAAAKQADATDSWIAWVEVGRMAVSNVAERDAETWRQPLGFISNDSCGSYDRKYTKRSGYGAYRLQAGGASCSYARRVLFASYGACRHGQ
jgi:hypothetical protein